MSTSTSLPTTPEKKSSAQEMNCQNLTQTLVESFNALADEVQNLSDRQTVLEHKLRYAHEQFQYLADKYAPAAPEISETLLNLQVPPELHNPSLANTSFVPLPKRKASDSKHQIAIIIREGRRVASSLTATSKSSRSSRDSFPPTTMTTLSTILEQDFTVAGKKGKLDCPFSQADAKGKQPGSRHTGPPTATHDAQDPICAAMYDDTHSQGAATKCPIRYLDQHSPEEIAHYLETHKHELPRSHEVCVRRYQKNEEHIKKLDAKYGNLASMVEGLSRIHQPMLPDQDTRPQSEVERTPNERVETWAQTVSASATEDPERATPEHDGDDMERQSHFDRPLKEVRVGESPSRPWGISVPIFDTPPGANGLGRPESPPPAPVPIPSLLPSSRAETPAKRMGKCPFDHTKLTTPTPKAVGGAASTKREDKGASSVRLGDVPVAAASSQPSIPAPPEPARTAVNPPSFQQTHTQPAFINVPELERERERNRKQEPQPQMLFTGPVFIGYPIEDAIRLMQSLRGQQ
ncbi:hypothetical protein GGS23DRAFT_573047 [Durotheca rogersii]|uniref:uncharacterized protein n=1 Tax=Durotheca rogersii TaxID=419775 RepID=UPI002220F55A|nr:uncharacterized protein GGS23DRAFT_573047 [Durotheca rogersii]KAI5862176.1 hypothetical protein GGS23DRAFT_573047 [Durotheca rogersii]